MSQPVLTCCSMTQHRGAGSRSAPASRRVGTPRGQPRGRGLKQHPPPAERGGTLLTLSSSVSAERFGVLGRGDEDGRVPLQTQEPPAFILTPLCPTVLTPPPPALCLVGAREGPGTLLRCSIRCRRSNGRPCSSRIPQPASCIPHPSPILPHPVSSLLHPSLSVLHPRSAAWVLILHPSSPPILLPPPTPWSPTLTHPTPRPALPGVISLLGGYLLPGQRGGGEDLHRGGLCVPPAAWLAPARCGQSWVVGRGRHTPRWDPGRGRMRGVPQPLWGAGMREKFRMGAGMDPGVGRTSVGPRGGCWVPPLSGGAFVLERGG